MKRIIIIAGSLVLAGILGLGAGAAVASGPSVLSPAGLHPASGIQSVPIPAPTYPANANGQTYGSAEKAISSATEPDLIQAVASNGTVGYVSKAQLDQADGATAAASFKSPADAVAWEQSSADVDHTINVYAKDGTTVVGTFTVAGYATQQKEAAEQSTK
jgi:hypothetical protein